MFGKRLALLAAIAAFLPAQIAMAQTQTPVQSSGLIGLDLASNSIAAVNASEQGQRGGSAAARKYIPRVFAGLWLNDDANGFTLGGGASLHPFTDAKHEIQGNVAYNRVDGSNGFGLDIDYLYNFTGSKAGAFTPYAGGGLNVTHFSGDCGNVSSVLGISVDCGSTDSALQIGGGVKKPLTNGKDFFVEGYIVFFDSTTFILRAGLGW